MERKINTKLSEINENGIEIKQVSAFDDIDLDASIFPECKIRYYEEHEISNYYIVIISYNKIIQGHYIADIILDSEGIKNLKLLELCIYNDYKPYGEMLVKHLINSLEVLNIKRLSFNLSSASIELMNIFSKYDLNILEKIGFINNPNYKLQDDEIHLKRYDTDKISIEDVYFLYGLGFTLGIDQITYKDEIIIDRYKNTVLFNALSRCENLELNNKTKNMIHMLLNENINSYDLVINRNKSTSYIDAYLLDKAMIYSDNNIYYNYELLNKMYCIDGIDFINVYKVIFDYRYLIYNTTNDIIDIKNYLYSKKKYLDLPDCLLREKGQKLKESQVFNNKLNKTRLIEFSYGNSFSGIMKLVIDLDNNTIKDNSPDKINNTIDKEKIINDLKDLNLYLWKKEYISNNSSPWKLVIKLEEESLEFKGCGAYPNSWIILIDFIQKYSNLDLRSKMINE